MSQHAAASLHRSSSSPGAAAPPTPPRVKAEDGAELEPRAGGWEVGSVREKPYPTGILS